MTFDSFLKQLLKKDFWANDRLVCFTGSNYPFLFFSNLFRLLNDYQVLPAVHKNLIIDSIDKITLEANLQQSFLGQQSFYWLGEYKLSSTGKSKTELLNSLLEYKGPNFISFYLNDEKLPVSVISKVKKIKSIKIDNVINRGLFLNIAQLFNKKFIGGKNDIIKKLFDQKISLTLDQACMLINYLELMNVRQVNEFYEYISYVITDVSPSLHVLSQYFFSKNVVAFFKTWSEVYNDYSDMFWITFWSEQVFRAYHVVNFLKQNQIAQARGISFRLPFSFIQKDWRSFSLNELADSYQFLYNNDFRIKRGSTFCGLDLFYFNHFTAKNLKRI